MYPVLFHAGSLAVPTHGLFTLLGLLIAGLVLLRESRERGMWNLDMAAIASGAVFGAAVGARAGNWWLYVTAGGHVDLPGLLVDGGKSVLGGLTGAYVGVLAAKRFIGYRGRTGDVFAPAAALGIAVGRIGCFLTEQIGTRTTMPWGFVPPPETLSRIPNCPDCLPGVAMHPSFLYEIGVLLALYGGLRWARTRVTEPGELFTLFLAGYAACRFGLEFVRGNPVVGFGLTRSQVFLLCTMPAFAWHGVRQWRAGVYRGLLPKAARAESDHRPSEPTRSAL